MNAKAPLAFSLREQIVDRIRNDVLSGRLVEGERLNEAKLGEQFRVSRTPIREALQQLTHEGLLEGRPNHGVKVANCPPDSIRELVVPIRRRVETFALRSFFAEISAADFELWDEILRKLRAACVARDFAAIAEYDIEFHRSIVGRANQRDLEAIWMALVARVRSHFWKTQRRDYADPLPIYEEHVRIVEVFRGGDVEAAVKVLEKNIH
jgi:DNA-binding GntR family transcriptional regulator